MKKLILSALILATSFNASAAHKIVSVGSNITEILFALDLDEQVVAADKTSTVPPEAEKIATLGHPSNVSMEGVFSYYPTSYISDDRFPNPTLISKLEAANIDVLVLKQALTLDDLFEQIKVISVHYGKTAEGKALIHELTEKKAKLKRIPEKEQVKAAFLYGRGSLLMMGANTTVDHLFSLAQIKNSFDFEGTKPVNPESVIIANPDALVTVDKALRQEEDKSRFFELPGMSATNAGKNKSITTIPIKQVNIGLKTIDTALELNKHFYDK
ncbi:heme/hemin ABC transporter substrate-binding protein [Vibrio rotiferianus]|uniref:heme/hemin ABC transporter substrate-binding protein n=1 Tax=Vibrio rotiferianus TaxID=190895 RepID=UPI00148CE933|nr:ABC transporter substrate-binding protein [Vibrio rotiferianus]NOH68165.1 ABC transporter substrate-binding protein [Vibrio rotiferianus]